MNAITNRIPAYIERSRHDRAEDMLEFQRRFMAGLAIQRRVTQGKRKLKLVSLHATPASDNKAHKQRGAK